MQEIQRILAADPGTPLGEIAVLARAHRTLQPLRALCEVTGMSFELVSAEAVRSRLSFMQLREGRQMVQALPQRRNDLVELGPLKAWLADHVRREPAARDPSPAPTVSRARSVRWRARSAATRRRVLRADAARRTPWPPFFCDCAIA